MMVWYSTRSFLVFTGYARHVGEVVSTSSLNSNLDGVMTAETPDTVFGTNASAYRLRSVTQVLALGISRAANDHSSLNLAVDRLLAHADGGNNYYASMLSMSYVHAF